MIHWFQTVRFFLMGVFLLMPPLALSYVQSLDCPGYNPPQTTPTVQGYRIFNVTYLSAGEACSKIPTWNGTAFQGCPAFSFSVLGSPFPAGTEGCTSSPCQGGTVNTSFSQQGIIKLLTCPAGYTLNGSTCNLSNAGLTSCPTCGNSSTKYSDTPKSCVADVPATCPLLAEHDAITGVCFVPPVCQIPQRLSNDHHSCIDPDCGANRSFDVSLNRCVAVPPVCDSNTSYLVGDANSGFQPYCAPKPSCPSGQNYGCVGTMSGNTKSEACGCLGPQNCPGGQSWGSVNGKAGCYGPVGAAPLPQPPPGTTPNPKPGPTLPGGPPTPPGDPGPDGNPPAGDSRCTDPAKACWNFGLDMCTACQPGEGGNGGKCAGGQCPCNVSGVLGVDETKCPASGVCPSNMFSTPSGNCSLKPGNCPVGQHYEFSSLGCVPDSGSGVKPPADQGQEAITARLDNIITNTKPLTLLNSGSIIPGDKGFGSDANTLLNNARTEYSNKIAEIRSNLSNLSSHLSVTSSDLPYWVINNVKGQVVHVDLNNQNSALSLIPPIIVFLAWLIAFSIILG